MKRNTKLILTLALAMLVASPAMAAAPTTSMLDGVLTSSGGSAAADGDYDITFSIYDAASGGTKVWSEGPVKVKVSGGRFAHALGSSTALDIAKLTAAKGQWLALKVGSDPELPAQSMHASVFSLYAGTAGALSCDGCISGDQIANGSMAAAKMGFNYAGSTTKGGPAADLACTACVSVAEMKFDGDVDLGGNSLKGKNGTFTGTVAAAEFVGDGSKLTGLKTPAGECKNAGEVVKGINADGTLKCVAALDPTALPKDGLNEISNDLISNQFVDTIAGASNVAIPDNTGAEANAVLDFPDIGVSQTFELTVDVSNTDLSTLSLTILPPDDKKTGWTLCDPCGDKDAKSYKKTFSKDALPKSGDLAKWINANPKGTWNLKALDTSFCIPQAPGNSGICDVNAKTDGKIVSWSIKIQTLSNKKISINGDSYQSGTTYAKNVDISGSLVLNGVTYSSFAKPATFRYAEWHTYSYSQGWFLGNSSTYFGGVAPSTWSDGNGLASSMSSDKEVLRTLFNRKRWAGKNAMVVSTQWRQYDSSTAGRHAAVLFRIRNNTSNDIIWRPYYYYSSYGSWNEYASIALNGVNAWSTGGNCSWCTSNVQLTIPKNRISTVIMVVGSGHPYGWYGTSRPLNLTFYNNSLALPTGLEYVDDLDTATGGWDQ